MNNQLSYSYPYTYMRSKRVMNEPIYNFSSNYHIKKEIRTQVHFHLKIKWPCAWFWKSAESKSTWTQVDGKSSHTPSPLLGWVIWFLGPKCTYFLLSFFIRKSCGKLLWPFYDDFRRSKPLFFFKIQAFEDWHFNSFNWIKYKFGYL